MWIVDVLKLTVFNSPKDEPCLRYKDTWLDLHTLYQQYTVRDVELAPAGLGAPPH